MTVSLKGVSIVVRWDITCWTFPLAVRVPFFSCIFSMLIPLTSRVGRIGWNSLPHLARGEAAMCSSYHMDKGHRLRPP
jgi:hypothetical protein